MFTILTTGTVAVAALSTAIAGCADQDANGYIEPFLNRGVGGGYRAPYASASASNLDFGRVDHGHRRTPYHDQHNYYHGGRSQPAYAWYPWDKTPHRGFVPMDRNGAFNREYPSQPAMSGPLNLFKPAMKFDDDWHMETGQTDMFAPMGMFDTGHRPRSLSSSHTGFNHSSSTTFGGFTGPTFSGTTFDRPRSASQGHGNPPCRCGMLLCNKCMGREMH